MDGVEGGDDECASSHMTERMTESGNTLTMTDHPSLVATTSEDQYYRPLLMRYIKNEAQSEVAKATRGGKSLP